MHDDFSFNSFSNGGFNQSIVGSFDPSFVGQWDHWPGPTPDSLTFSEPVVDLVAESYNFATTDPIAIGMRLQRELREKVLRSGDEAVATSIICTSICSGTVNPKGYFGFEAWICLSSDEQEYWEELWAEKAAAVAQAQRIADELTSAKIEAALIKDQWPEDYFGERWEALHPETKANLVDYWNRLATLDQERLGDAIERWLDQVCAPLASADDEDVDDRDLFADHDKVDTSKFADHLSRALRRRLKYSGTESTSGWLRPTEEEWSRMPTGHMQSYNAAYESFANMVC